MKTKFIRVIAAGVAVLALGWGAAAAQDSSTSAPSADTSWGP